MNGMQSKHNKYHWKNLTIGNTCDRSKIKKTWHTYHLNIPQPVNPYSSHMNGPHSLFLLLFRNNEYRVRLIIASRFMIMINSTDQNRQYECTSKSFYVYSVFNKQKLKIPTRALLTYSVPFIQVDATSTTSVLSDFEGIPAYCLCTVTTISYLHYIFTSGVNCSQKWI